MSIEIALIKPVVDALLTLFRQADNLRLHRNAEAALADAIRELLLAHPDENKAEAQIAVARAAGILSADIVLAEDMLEKHRAARPRLARKRSGRAPSPAKRGGAQSAAGAEADASPQNAADAEAAPPCAPDDGAGGARRGTPSRARSARPRTPTAGD